MNLKRTKIIVLAFLQTLAETRLTFEEIERLLLKFLLAKGSATGRELCQQIKLPFQIVDPIFEAA